MLELILIRHPKSKRDYGLDGEDCFTGSTNVPVTDEGKAQVALIIREFLRMGPSDAVLTAPSDRAQYLATRLHDAVMLKNELVIYSVMNQLRERSLGSLELQPYGALNLDGTEPWVAVATKDFYRNEEPMKNFLERVKNAYGDILSAYFKMTSPSSRRNARIAVVGSHSTLNALLNFIERPKLRTKLEYHFLEPGSLSVCQLDNSGKYISGEKNITRHLQDREGGGE